MQYYSTSTDNGATWGAIYPSTLSSPVSPASIRIISRYRGSAAVWNDNDGSRPAIKGKRTPLTLAVSRDDGKTWGHFKTIENDPKGWYCYTGDPFL